MSSAPIFFQFDEKKSALLAMDTLMELGFRADLLDHRHPEHIPTLQVDVERGDLTSALEIAQSHGGTLCDAGTYGEEAEAFDSAYNLGAIPIPAHTVTEDLPDGYLSGDPGAATVTGPHDDGLFDPSEHDFDQFPAGIRL